MLQPYIESATVLSDWVSKATEVERYPTRAYIRRYR